MSYSIQREVSDGTLTSITLAIEFIDQADIHIYVDDIEMDKVGGSTPYLWDWVTRAAISITPAVPLDSVVLVRRITPKDKVHHNFNAGAVFKDTSVDENFRQALYLAQEALEGGASADFYNDLDMHGYTIHNSGPALVDGDLVSLGQYRADALGAFAYRKLSERYANALQGTQVEPGKYSAFHWATVAESARDVAVAAKDTVVASATAAGNSAGDASISATNAANSASASDAARVLAQDAAIAATTTYDSFDNRYLGSKVIDPIVDNDGNPLQVGTLYWNTAANEMRVYSGSTWEVSFLPVGAYVTTTDLANPDKGAAMVARGVVAVDRIADLMELPEGQLREDLRYITAGYYLKGDGGGARYFLSDTDPGYGIPLPGGMYALFDDSFDIRKFGILDNGTLDQTEVIRRMVAYADSRVYEIDFLNYTIMTPKIWAWVPTKGVVAGTTTPTNVTPSQVMGMAFENAHKIKRLKIVNDKTARLETGHNQINFLPVTNPAVESWFILEDVTFDPWVDDYQPRSENYLGNFDGMRHGFFCFPGMDSEIKAWSSETTNYSFEFKNVHFESPAYSYNLTPSSIHARNTKVRNLTGEHLCIGLNYFSDNLDVDGVDTVFRSDYKEAGRAIVTNAIHYEAELTLEPYTKLGDVEIKNAKCTISDTGSLWTVFKLSSIGDTSMESARFVNVSGQISFEKTSIDKIIIEDCNPVNLVLPNMNHVGHVSLSRSNLISILGSYGSAAFIITSSIERISLVDVELGTTLHHIDIYEGKTVGELYAERIHLTGTGIHGIGAGAALHVEKMVIKDATIAKGLNMLSRCSLRKAFINGVHIEGDESDQIETLIRTTGTIVPDIHISGVICDRNNAPYNSMFEGTANVTLKDSTFRQSPKYTSNVVLKETNVTPVRIGTKTYDPATLAAGAVQFTTVVLKEATVGEPVVAAFSLPLQGTRMWAETTAAGMVTVYHQNPTAQDVNVGSGTLTVRLA